MFAEWVWFALGSAVFAALTAILSKIGVSGIPSNLATLVRTAVVLVLAAALVWGRGEWREISGRTLLFLVLSGVATGLSWLCYFRALQLGPASQVAPLDKLSVVFVLVLSALFLGERLSWVGLLGAFLVSAGSILLVLA